MPVNTGLDECFSYDIFARSYGIPHRLSPLHVGRLWGRVVRPIMLTVITLFAVKLIVDIGRGLGG